MLMCLSEPRLSEDAGTPQPRVDKLIFKAQEDEGPTVGGKKPKWQAVQIIEKKHICL